MLIAGTGGKAKSAVGQVSLIGVVAVLTRRGAGLEKASCPPNAVVSATRGNGLLDRHDV
jgi:hypothetical protein